MPSATETLRNQANAQLPQLSGEHVVSAVMPVYNGAKYLHESIGSALNQRGVVIEVVAVDDGSTDESAEILQSYGDRVRYIRQENAGPAAARNRGLQEASGNWIAFLDQDDIWEPDKIIRQLATAERTGADVIYTNARNFGELSRVGEIRNDPARMPSGDVFEDLLLDNFLTMASVIVKRDRILSVNGFVVEEAGVDDWDVWLKVAAEGAVFAAVPEPLLRYRWHSESLSKRHDMMRQRRLRVLKAALKSKRGQQVSWINSRRALSGVHSSSAWFVAEQSLPKAVRWYTQALLAWPFSFAAWKGLAKSCLGRT